MEHFIELGQYRISTVYKRDFWFILSRPQDTNNIEQTWAANQNIEAISDNSSNRVLVSICVKYWNIEDGAPIRELKWLFLKQ
jgi:hypothetical protein